MDSFVILTICERLGKCLQTNQIMITVETTTLRMYFLVLWILPNSGTRRVSKKNKTTCWT